MSTQIHTLISRIPWDELHDLAIEHLTSTPAWGCAVGERWSALFVPLDLSFEAIEAMSEHVPLIELSHFYDHTLALWHDGEVLTAWSSDHEIDTRGGDLYGIPVTRPGEQLNPAWHQHFGVAPDPYDVETMLSSMGIDREVVMLDVRDAPEEVLGRSDVARGDHPSVDLYEGPASLYWYDAREAAHTPAGIECELVNTGGPLLAIEVTCWCRDQRISLAQVTYRSERHTLQATRGILHIALPAGLKSEPPPSLARHEGERTHALALWSSRRFTLCISTAEPLTRLVLRAHGLDGEPADDFIIDL